MSCCPRLIPRKPRSAADAASVASQTNYALTNIEDRYCRLQLVAEAQPAYGVGASDERGQGQGQGQRQGQGQGQGQGREQDGRVGDVAAVKAVGRSVAGGAGSVGGAG